MFLYLLFSANPLNDMILHYEPLYYDQHKLHHNHYTAKRGTGIPLKLALHAHGE